MLVNLLALVGLPLFVCLSDQNNRELAEPKGLCSHVQLYQLLPAVAQLVYLFQAGVTVAFTCTDNVNFLIGKNLL